MRGAEAVLRNATFLGRTVVIKDRIPKRYRAAELDRTLRTQRTRQEARLLHRAKLTGVPTPVVLAVGEFSITMTKLPGQRPKMTTAEAKQAGQYLAWLHTAHIIHGDYTPANLRIARSSRVNGRGGGRLASGFTPQASRRLYVIDFGLGFFSRDVEDKAIDTYTMLKMLPVKEGNAFLQGYRKYGKYDEVIKRIEQVKARVRYA